jgi:hypothetical protein
MRFERRSTSTQPLPSYHTVINTPFRRFALLNVGPRSGLFSGLFSPSAVSDTESTSNWSILITHPTMAEKQEKPKPTAVDKGKGKEVEKEEKKDRDGKPVKDEKLDLPPGMLNYLHRQ